MDSKIIIIINTRNMDTFELEGTAASFFQKIDAKQTVKEILKKVSPESLENRQALKGVETILRELQKNQLIIQCK